MVNKGQKYSWNLRSLNFLATLTRENKQFAIIGLGRFGRSVAASLHKMGYEVLGVDIDEKLVARAINDSIATHAICLDSTEPNALKEAGIFEFDTVIIAIGNYIQESIITTLNVKEAGVSNVIAKASTEIHGKLLEKVGADRVVFPEYEAGEALAYMLTKPAILDRFDLDPDHSIVEVLIPEEFDGKTITELQLRSLYGLTVLAIAEDDKKFDINPLPNRRLHQGMAMVVLGNNKDIKRLPI
ncbi:TrkA family potassium uptake protein [Spirulina sp. 06S082]|uniref:potassium channel family protein n=1 Tax=Spirulina sp. 06S082 TaxID=3110248 RepID=UPI002B20E952|nr:TrkA family potassium uptake protein [Spirulina sp. 06S082]MEA5468397.1 TrkA family potassium uptake protein [Spirulina sp. 06S082]